MLLFPASHTFAQKLSHDELIEILGIQSWRVAMPKDESMEWSIEVVDYSPLKYVNPNTARLNPKKKALIVLRESGKNSYAFTLKQSGMGQGELEINICSEREKRENDCDDSFEIEWFEVPKPFDDGTKFVIAEIKQMVRQVPRKRIILEPVRYRLADNMKENRRLQ